MKIDKEQFEQMIKEYLKEHLVLSVQVKSDGRCYNDDKVVEVSVSIDGEVISTESDFL